MSFNKNLYSSITSIILNRRQVKITCKSVPSCKALRKYIMANYSYFGTPKKYARGVDGKSMIYEFVSDDLSRRFVDNLKSVINQASVSKAVLSRSAAVTTSSPVYAVRTPVASTPSVPSVPSPVVVRTPVASTPSVPSVPSPVVVRTPVASTPSVPSVPSPVVVRTPVASTPSVPSVPSPTPIISVRPQDSIDPDEKVLLISPIETESRKPVIIEKNSQTELTEVIMEESGLWLPEENNVLLEEDVLIDGASEGIQKKIDTEQNIKPVQKNDKKSMVVVVVIVLLIGILMLKK